MTERSLARDDFINRRKLHSFNATKLDFVDREKHILLVAFSRRTVDVRGEEVDFRRRTGRMLA